MKRITLALIFLLLASPAWPMSAVYRHLEPETVAYQSLANAAQTQFATNENTKSIKYGSGITLASISANFSLADGAAFITNPSVDLHPYVGFKVSTPDGSVGWIKAAGTGETLGLSLMGAGNCTNASGAYTTFDGVSATGFHAIHNAAAARHAATANQISITAGWLTKRTVALTLTAGTAPSWTIRGDENGTLRAGAGGSLTAGANAFYDTQATTDLTSVIDFQTGTVVEYTVAGIDIKQVLTPSATGVTITLADMVTRNWIAKGTTPNAASFAITITRN